MASSEDVQLVRIKATLCLYCGSVIEHTGVLDEAGMRAIRDAMEAHDRQCKHNPLVVELDATRARVAELELALAASQAECAELREVLRAARDATEAAQEGTDIEGQTDQSALDAYEEGTRAVLRALTPILSRAPGDRAALREMLTTALMADRTAMATMFGLSVNESDIAAIVSRLLGERGEEGAKG